MPDKVIVTSGKRKTSVARAVIKPGRGIIRINSVPLDAYGNPLARLRILEPLMLAGEEYVSKVDIYVDVKGGGVMSQAEAVRLAIARALVKYFEDEKLEKLYDLYDRWLLTADVRRKEQRKSPTSKARKHYQTAYR